MTRDFELQNNGSVAIDQSTPETNYERHRCRGDNTRVTLEEHN
ncbi:hypothetical protein [Lentibacillus sp. CBA3610]|nr:hypothetical protein Len3610_12920 [Lentibacillus sp. CBA3610]